MVNFCSTWLLNASLCSDLNIKFEYADYPFKRKCFYKCTPQCMQQDCMHKLMVFFYSSCSEMIDATSRWVLNVVSVSCMQSYSEKS